MVFLGSMALASEPTARSYGQRPERDLSKDWPNIGGKPVDHPFGPFADSIPEAQHKFGPFGPIAEIKAAAKKNKP